MISICESMDFLLEYINKPRSEMTPAELKRVKYASIKKRESLTKQKQLELPVEMFDLYNPNVQRKYQEIKKKIERMQKMAAEKEKKEKQKKK